eukprot:5042431-Pyramimonas_sp.AAC.1
MLANPPSLPLVLDQVGGSPCCPVWRTCCAWRTWHVRRAHLASFEHLAGVHWLPMAVDGGPCPC